LSLDLQCNRHKPQSGFGAAAEKPRGKEALTIKVRQIQDRRAVWRIPSFFRWIAFAVPGLTTIKGASP